ncbi:hypothetical protein D3C80_1557130 [compost metagenome]
MPVSASLPVRTDDTAWVSPLATLSTSVSLSSTLPLGSTPATLLLSPPASMATALSSLATGVSLRPLISTMISARSVRVPSLWVKVKRSSNKSLARRRACTSGLSLSSA